MWSQTAGIHSIKPSLKIDSRPAPRPAGRRHPTRRAALGWAQLGPPGWAPAAPRPRSHPDASPGQGPAHSPPRWQSCSGCSILRPSLHPAAIRGWMWHLGVPGTPCSHSPKPLFGCSCCPALLEHCAGWNLGRWGIPQLGCCGWNWQRKRYLKVSVPGTPPLPLQLVKAFRETPAGQNWVKDFTSVR